MFGKEISERQAKQIDYTLLGLTLVIALLNSFVIWEKKQLLSWIRIWNKAPAPGLSTVSKTYEREREWPRIPLPDLGDLIWTGISLRKQVLSQTLTNLLVTTRSACRRFYQILLKSVQDLRNTRLCDGGTKCDVATKGKNIPLRMRRWHKKRIFVSFYKSLSKKRKKTSLYFNLITSKFFGAIVSMR